MDPPEEHAQEPAGAPMAKQGSWNVEEEICSGRVAVWSSKRESFFKSLQILVGIGTGLWLLTALLFGSVATFFVLGGSLDRPSIPVVNARKFVAEYSAAMDAGSIQMRSANSVSSAVAILRRGTRGVGKMEAVQFKVAGLSDQAARDATEYLRWEKVSGSLVFGRRRDGDGEPRVYVQPMDVEEVIGFEDASDLKPPSEEEDWFSEGEHEELMERSDEQTSVDWRVFRGAE